MVRGHGRRLAEERWSLAVNSGGSTLIHHLEGEVQETQPAVIVCKRCIQWPPEPGSVVPITSKVARIYPSDQSNKAMADQLATVSKRRFQARLGTLSSVGLRTVEIAIPMRHGLSSRLA